MELIIIRDIQIEVIRKDIKNLHLSVHPPDGRVRISSPQHLNNEAIRLFAISRLSWIRRNIKEFNNQKREPVFEYVSGESHYYKGVRYLLNVVYHDRKPKVEIRNKKYIDLFVRTGSSQEKRKEVLNEWYRGKLKKEIVKLLEKWQPIIGVDVTDFGVRQMKTKWGTCSEQVKRIWLNLELAKKPFNNLEYVVVHELLHLIEHKHNERFIALMDKFLPNWRSLKKELNNSPLGH